MKDWDFLRTAYHVARAGTVSAAAEAMGVHHATVIRHVDGLENSLGVKLFHRHARGYTPTEAGQDVLRVAEMADDQFALLAGRLQGQSTEFSGPLIVTSLAAMAELIAPALARFQQMHPQISINFVTEDRLLRLDYGEAHIAIRAAATAPDVPDYVVQKLLDLPSGMFGAESYAQAHGLPRSEADLAEHRFVGPSHQNGRAPWFQWLKERVPETAFSFRCSSMAGMAAAIREGAGLGFLPIHSACDDEGLLPALPRNPAWDSAMWLVTHVDLHRSPKVQAALAHLKEEALVWSD